MDDTVSEEDARTFIRRRLTEDLEAIVNGFLEKAKAGSAAHMKLTTELLAPPRGQPAERQTVRRAAESSTLQKLLDRMGSE